MVGYGEAKLWPFSGQEAADFYGVSWQNFSRYEQIVEVLIHNPRRFFFGPWLETMLFSKLQRIQGFCLGENWA